MLIKINLEIAENFEVLNKLITLIDLSEGQHSIYVPSPDIESAIFKTLADHQHILELFKELYEKAENNIAFKKVITFSENPERDLSFSLNDMYRILTSKAYVILENKISDLRFILLVLKVVNAKALIDSFESFWEVESNGGCGEIPKLVDSICSRSEFLKRVMVVHDSDKYFAADNLSTIQVNIVNKCSAKGVECITLKKREIENYIPDSYLIEKQIDCKDTQSLWASLSSVQKDFYDFKDGFKNKAANDTVYGGLYHNLKQEDIKLLNDGFGSKISRLIRSV